MTKYNPLPTTKLTTGAAFVHPGALPEIVHLDDDAHTVMVDFHNTQPLAIHPHELVETALKEMKYGGVHMLLVIDQQDTVHGLITSEDLLGEKLIKIMQEKRITHAEVKVKMLMQSLEQTLTIHINELRHAKVGHIVETFRKNRQHYSLVVNEDKKICGLFSSFQISKQLHMDVNSMLSTARSVAELQKRIPK